MNKLLVIGLAIYAQASYATPVVYTNQADFLAALTGPAQTLDFDSFAPGQTIASGDELGGLTFSYNFGGVEMQVQDAWPTTSGPNYLGTTDLGIFQDGDDFSLGLGLVNAVGLSFITGDPLYDDDFLLSAAGTSVGLDASAVQQTLSDGSEVYFLGIIDTQNAFSTADITTIGGGYFLYNVDDIITSVVPLPPAVWLFVSGLLALARCRK